MFPVLETLLYICLRVKIDRMTNRLENIGLMIRNERLRKGLTQEELGERVGVGKAQISKIERGKGLTIKTVTKVLDALGMSASVVLKGEQEIDKNVIAYIVAAISEFAEIHHLSDFYPSVRHTLRHHWLDRKDTV